MPCETKSNYTKLDKWIREMYVYTNHNESNLEAKFELNMVAGHTKFNWTHWITYS